MRLLPTLLLVFSVSTVLSACGGGGDTAPSGNPMPTTAATANDTTLQTQVAAATYARGTVQRDAFDYLNAQRQICGFGLLQQTASIDTAAQAHADYLLTNHLQITHYEDRIAFPDGFTGVLPADRLAAAGYAAAPGAGSEVIGDPNASYGSTVGQAGVMDLFLAPYHGYAMLRSDRDVGIGFATNESRSPMVIDFGWTAQRPNQMLPASQVVTYPCEGITGVLSQSHHDENPTPLPGRNLQTDPIGHPVYLKVRDGNTLVLTSYALRQVGTGISLSLQLLDQAHDPASLFTDRSSAALIPLVPLAKNASYLFSAAGTNNGNPFSMSFTFGTGAD
jgi:uncharacterized protein YkwD